MAKIKVESVKIEYIEDCCMVLGAFEYSDGDVRKIPLGTARKGSAEFDGLVKEATDQVGISFDEDDPDVKGSLVNYDAADKKLLEYEPPEDLPDDALDMEQLLLEEYAESAWRLLLYYCGGERAAQHIYRRYARL